MSSHFIYRAVRILAPLLWASSSFSAGYTQNLFLCDMGMMNPDGSNTKGVDYVQYTQNGQNLVMRATPVMSTAMDLATQQILGYDRWNPVYGIDNVTFNLSSDYYGSQYYLEYCYMWDRVAPVDSIQYSILYSSALPVAVPNTDVTMDSKCSNLFADGGVTNADFPLTPMVQTLLGPDQISMRCTIRLTFKEATGAIQRPYNNDLGAVDPQILIKVSP